MVKPILPDRAASRHKNYGNTDCLSFCPPPAPDIKRGASRAKRMYILAHLASPATRLPKPGLAENKNYYYIQ